MVGVWVIFGFVKFCILVLWADVSAALSCFVLVYMLCSVGMEFFRFLRVCPLSWGMLALAVRPSWDFV